MDDIRWFAPNRFCQLPVPRLRAAGLRIATDGNAPARLAFVADGVCATEAYRYARGRGIPTLVYLWDLPPWQLEGGRPNRVVPVAGRLIKVPRLGGAYPGRNGYFSRQRYVARRAVEVWVPSALTRHDVRRHFGLDADEVPFCFDSDRFRPGGGWRRPAGDPVVLSVSHLVPHKNHAAILRAVARLSPVPRVRIVGGGVEAGALRSLAADLHVSLQLDEIRHADDEMADIYRTAAVLVCPSRFEGLGLTPLEGLAMGIPTIASDIPPHREFTAGRAVLVPLDDDVSMARAIAAALRAAPGAGPADRAPDLTIEGCAARFLPRLERVLAR